ncbi:hypothetical protein H3N56_02285 [Cetobacterium sp. 2A]|uniref:hypothetical protein n=1 Tax=Cetobacterium sp. 2A TaxID=2754723 RepID=UPI00163C4164|nr:hypothetical protein [Cetobacterium sp. 2A]MBC2855321.1 hypothetical protein [Cetobacterium sp. 2A]
MRTKRQGLEIQVEEIFKQFYKDKIVKEKVNSFIISEDEIRGMLTTDPQEK